MRTSLDKHCALAASATAFQRAHELALGQQRARRGAGAALAGARRLARLRLRVRTVTEPKFERKQYTLNHSLPPPRCDAPLLVPGWLCVDEFFPHSCGSQKQKMDDRPESDAAETAPKQSDAGPSQMSTSSVAIRDSTLSVSRFNRWLLSEIKRQTGDTVRDDMEHLRSQRRAANEHHQQWGASLGAASRAQMARDKQQYELLRRSNWQKGAQVRDDVEAQKSEALRLRAEWMEHGRRLAEKNQEQRGKVREATGDGCKRLTDLVAQCKLEEAEYEAELAHRRGEILRENQEEVKKVRSETADAVIDAAKQFALEQRRNQAKATKTDLSRWGAERSANTAFHLKTARTNRADAKATREHAKRLREKLQQERLQQAQLQRLAQKERITSKKANLEQIGGGLKMVTSPSTSRPQPECPNQP